LNPGFFIPKIIATYVLFQFLYYTSWALGCLINLHKSIGFVKKTIYADHLENTLIRFIPINVAPIEMISVIRAYSEAE